MHIQVINASSGRRITQAFKGRADQGGPTVTFIKKLQGGWHAEAIGQGMLAQGGDLARYRVGFSLLLGRDMGIDRGLHRRHSGYTPSYTPCGCSFAPETP